MGKNMSKLIKHGLLTSSMEVSANGFNYLYQLAMARMLGPVEYGILFSILSLYYIIYVLSQAVITVTARYTSVLKAKNENRKIKGLWKYITKKSIYLGIATTFLLLAATPLTISFLKVQPLPFIIMAFSMLFSYVLSTNQGILQGFQRFARFGLTRVSWTLIKFGVAVGLVYIGFGVEGALSSIFLANLIVFALALYWIKDIIMEKEEKFTINIFSYSGFTLLSTLAFTSIYSVDTILAKHFLDGFSAGIYSSISVLGKIILFAPTGIYIALFPKTAEMNELGSDHFDTFLKALAFLLLITLPVLVLFRLFPEFVVGLTFGGEFLIAKEFIFKYSIAMLLISAIGLAMKYLLSIGETNVAYLLLATVILEILGISYFHENIDDIINVILFSSIVCLLFFIPLLLRVWRGQNNNEIS
jgi:O-antigen/teichoic acid export membrane protein